MIVIAVDDESWALKELKYNLENEKEVEAVYAFSQGQEAIDWASNNSFDAAFLDINMRGMDGIELAKALRDFNQSCFIVFCTGYGEYAIDAFGLHATGYLLKPILPDKIHAEVEYISNAMGKSSRRIKVQCFGDFEVYDAKGQILKFKRKRAKELLALLVDANGVGLNAKEICDRLFDNTEENKANNLNHLYKLIQELKRVLKEAGASQVLINAGGDYFLDMQMIEKDESGKADGTYMGQFHWN